MFKSIFNARKRTVRVLLGLPSLHSDEEIDAFDNATNEKVSAELEMALPLESTRAPFKLLNDAITRDVGPEILKFEVSFPVVNTP